MDNLRTTVKVGNTIPCAACLGCDICLLRAGNLRTMDKGGPYNLTLLPVQVNEIRGEHLEPAIHTYIPANVMFAQCNLYAQPSNVLGRRLQICLVI